MRKEKHAFVYDSHFKPYHQQIFFWDIIDNRTDAPICVMEGNDRITDLNLKHALKNVFGGLCTVEYVYEITPW